MKALLKYCITLFATWLLLFFVNRIFFLCYQLPIGSRIIHSLDILKSFVEGYRLEISTACILLCLPLVFALLYYVFQHKIFLRISLILVTSLLVLYNLTSLADAGIYREWNAKINLQALAHFKNPSEVAKTISWHLLGVALLALIVFSLPFYYLYKNKILPLLYVESKNSILHRSVQSFIFLALSAGIIVIGIRGGITNIPINQSAAYFSNDVMANDIAVNPLYNILQDVTITGVIPDTTVYKLRSNIEAQQIIADDFYKIQDTFPLILNTTKPNLVFIFLESWSADNVGVLGGVAGCTPSFDALSQEGVLFENAYGEAYVSDQGIPAVLSSYPSVSRLSIINQPIKVPGMHCISETLLPLGYTSSFMFGGDLVYGNLRGYLLEKKFTNLLEERDYASLPKGKLGIHDEYLFPELLKKLNNSQQPFLQGFFTVSTHMPYDFKPCDNWQSTKNDAEKSYTEATHYSDYHLGKFFEDAKKQTWYKNTLFVVVADHSHNTIKQWDASSAMRQKIPMLFVGGALHENWQGKRWNKVVSQLDVNATLLSQMNLPITNYPWSRNIFSPSTPSTAYYVFFGGIGYIKDSGFVAVRQMSNQTPITNLKDSVQINNMLHKANSFQQLVYEDVRLR